MSIAPIIAAQLPFLRRYARALTGSQLSGDSYVAAALETLVEDPSLFPKDMEPRIAVYQVFTRIWSSVRVNLEGDGAAKSGTPATRTLDALAPLSRQVFLLVSVEGFSTADTARILGISEDEVTRAIDDTGRELAGLVATDVLIIEDEPIIAMDLEALVESLGHRVAGVARTHKEAVALAEKTKPGLVLADIQLADGSSGLDAVNDILGQFDVPVIFITAYPERLLTGERPEPVFLISKPFQTQTVKAIVSQALFFGTRAHKRGARMSA
ncbi:response regulator [Terrihabitans rhizophilus]|jgi:CheY-like chemotaxis protein/DNA-directed RNA polymerase specialized sigma24 family protein|uniref:Response regulator n=1 Tax=Terrihabitans rhizophilus TaxID=3092662 RepID=A0ABU4RTV7_9HYPH|nr:response regulator [Terrihabitans sp. PJ23]MDX6807573.1 response regulator [Terrihabitans sp. PJ23]